LLVETDLVEEQHKVDAESDGQRDELHSEKVSRQKADNSLRVSSKVDGSEGRRLGLCGLRLSKFFRGGHGGQLTSTEIFLRSSTAKNY
jgi:hypothetical protein